MFKLKFAIIDSNVLTSIGLQAILARITPMAEVDIFQSFDEAMEADGGGYLHFFVSSRIYFEHAQYFRQCSTRSIVLVNGELNIAGVPTLNVCQSEHDLVRDLMARQGTPHGPHAGSPIPRGMLANTPLPSLTAREMEVVTFLSKGLINKEIANRMEVSLTTIITHRKNIMEKLHARSIADVIVYAVMSGLVDVGEL